MTHRISYHGPQSAELQQRTARDHSRKAMTDALAIRSLESGSLAALYLILVNDTRILCEYDLCCLVSHLGGTSELVAASNQSTINKKSSFYEHMAKLLGALRNLSKPIPWITSQDIQRLSDEVLPEELRAPLLSYMEFSNFQSLCIIPLPYRGEPVAHLIIELAEDSAGRAGSINDLLELSPILGASLATKWLLRRETGTYSLITEGAEPGFTGRVKRLKRFLVVAIVLAFLTITLFFIPVSFMVGGEAEIVAKDKHFAYSKIDGLLKAVYVREGQRVKEGEILAVLDPKQLEYETESARLKFEILTGEVELLRNSAETDLQKLAESQLKELQRESAWLDLQYFRWQHQFLKIPAPVSGIVITKAVETLVGKRLAAGDALCELIGTRDLWAEAGVAADRIAYVKPGQPFKLYLNNDPLKAYELKVKEIAPAPRLLERLGSVYFVRAPFPDAPVFLKPGLKGIGRIETRQTDIWTLLTTSLISRWNQLTLYFQ